MPSSEAALHTNLPDVPRSADDVYAAIKEALASGRFGAGSICAKNNWRRASA